MHFSKYIIEAAVRDYTGWFLMQCSCKNLNLISLRTWTQPDSTRFQVSTKYFFFLLLLLKSSPEPTFPLDLNMATDVHLEQETKFVSFLNFTRIFGLSNILNHETWSIFCFSFSIKEWNATNTACLNSTWKTTGRDLWARVRREPLLSTVWKD